MGNRRVRKIKGIMNGGWQDALDKGERRRVRVDYHRWEGGFCAGGLWGNMGCAGDKICCTHCSKISMEVRGKQTIDVKDDVGKLQVR